MNCYKKEETRYVIHECDEEETKLCEEFLTNYHIVYTDGTYGLYGMEQREVTISEYRHTYTGDNLTCIIENKEVKGCVFKGDYYFINGKNSYRKVEDSGPQGPLIWREQEWRLEKIK